MIDKKYLECQVVFFLFINKYTEVDLNYLDRK